jgi:hypothetical protein
MKYFVGILAILFGCFMVIKTEWIMENFGRSAWAEEHLGGGGSRLMYKLMGIAMVFLSLMMMTGMLGEIVIGFFGPLFGGAR